MSLPRLLLVLAWVAACHGLDKPSVGFTTTSFAYDLTATRPYLPIAWGVVNLAIPSLTGTDQVRLTVKFLRDGSDGIPTTDATDLLTVRTGLGVEVNSDTAFTTYAGANFLLATEMEAWTWGGPVHGGTTAANILTCTSVGPVRAVDALRALRQVFYANLGGPRALARRQLMVTVERKDGAVWTASTATPIYLPLVAAIPPPMPVQLRFEPVALVQGGAAVPLRLADLAGTITAATTCSLTPVAVPPGLVVSGTLDLSALPLCGLNIAAEAAASAADSGIHRVEIVTPGLTATTTFLEVAVTNDPTSLAIFGNPPLQFDVTAAGQAYASFQASTINLTLAVTAHPGGPALSAGELGQLTAAITIDHASGGTLTVAFDADGLRPLLAPAATTHLLRCALCFSVIGAPPDAPVRLIPCVLLLRRSPGG